jgi:hypothetical protein
MPDCKFSQLRLRVKGGKNGLSERFTTLPARSVKTQEIPSVHKPSTEIVVLSMKGLGKIFAVMHICSWKTSFTGVEMDVFSVSIEISDKPAQACPYVSRTFKSTYLASTLKSGPIIPSY